MNILKGFCNILFHHLREGLRIWKLWSFLFFPFLSQLINQGWVYSLKAKWIFDIKSDFSGCSMGSKYQLNFTCLLMKFHNCHHINSHCSKVPRKFFNNQCNYFYTKDCSFNKSKPLKISLIFEKTKSFKEYILLYDAHNAFMYI